MSQNFKRHFRVYLINNHPAYIIDQEGNQYVFHRMTESRSSGGRNNWKMKVNPVENCYFTCYMVRREQKADKARFSKQKLRTKKGVDISYPWIKRAKKKWPIGHNCRWGGAHNLMMQTIAHLIHTSEGATT